MVPFCCILTWQKRPAVPLKPFIQGHWIPLRGRSPWHLNCLLMAPSLILWIGGCFNMWIMGTPTFRLTFTTFPASSHSQVLPKAWAVSVFGVSSLLCPLLLSYFKALGLLSGLMMQLWMAYLPRVAPSHSPLHHSHMLIQRFNDFLQMAGKVQNSEIQWLLINGMKSPSASAHQWKPFPLQRGGICEVLASDVTLSKKSTRKVFQCNYLFIFRDRVSLCILGWRQTPGLKWSAWFSLPSS
jgi:hypothetical protein